MARCRGRSVVASLQSIRPWPNVTWQPFLWFSAFCSPISFAHSVSIVINPNISNTILKTLESCVVELNTFMYQVPSDATLHVQGSWSAKTCQLRIVRFQSPPLEHAVCWRSTKAKTTPSNTNARYILIRTSAQPSLPFRSSIFHQKTDTLNGTHCAVINHHSREARGVD